MSLADWLDHGFIVEHRTSRQEIHELLAMVDRDLHESETGTHSPEWKFSISYNAILQAALATRVIKEETSLFEGLFAIFILIPGVSQVDRIRAHFAVLTSGPSVTYTKGAV